MIYFNLIPARLTALSYALCGSNSQRHKVLGSTSQRLYSPNAGPVMAAGAGALQVKLGGAAVYHGKEKVRPALGLGEAANHTHILAAMH